MPGLTAPELCRIAGMNFKRFETLRRRAREEFARAEVVDGETFVFPVDDDSSVGWMRYGFNDLLALAATVALERQGVDFKSAARIATRVDQRGVLPIGGDFWIGRQHLILSDGSEALPFVDGDYARATGPCFAGAETVSVIVCNVSSIERRVRAELAASGYQIIDDRISRTKATAGDVETEGK